MLRAVARAHARGAVLIAASGAASALSGVMIAGGSSYEALRYGASSDTGHRGLVIQDAFDEYAQAEPGSQAELDAGEQLDQAFRGHRRRRDRLHGPPRLAARQPSRHLPECDGERATMEVAVEAFTAKNDRGPESENELVTEGFIRQPSDEFELTNGEVTPAPGSVCPSAA